MLGRQFVNVGEGGVRVTIYKPINIREGKDKNSREEDDRAEEVTACDNVGGNNAAIFCSQMSSF